MHKDKKLDRKKILKHQLESGDLYTLALNKIIAMQQ